MIKMSSWFAAVWRHCADHLEAGGAMCNHHFCQQETGGTGEAPSADIFLLFIRSMLEG